MLGICTPRLSYIGDKLLQEVLREAGVRPSDIKTFAPTQRTPTGVLCVLALGDAAAAALCSDWNGSVRARRGYIHEDAAGTLVVPSVSPDEAFRQWVPWRHLLAYDIKRAKTLSKRRERFERPVRNVHVVSGPRDARVCAEMLCSVDEVAFDIENYDEREIACVGFAPTPDYAVVFPAAYMDDARTVLECSVPKIAQNGQYDLYYLLTRCGIRVEGFCDDTLLAWHACYPELAGAALDVGGRKKGSKRTHKSLAFLASLYCEDAWWKDYEFASERERYVLNGRDCCITLEVMQALRSEIASLDVERIYRHEIGLVWPVVDAQALGLQVDDARRQDRIALLDCRIETLIDDIGKEALPLIEAALPKLDPSVAKLFVKREVCRCCRNGSGKRDACWACAGYSKKPSKKKLTDDDISLEPCRACDGRGDATWLEFNPISVPQKQALLYDVLHLPRRFVDGKLSTDEETLKALLATVTEL